MPAKDELHLPLMKDAGTRRALSQEPLSSQEFYSIYHRLLTESATRENKVIPRSPNGPNNNMPN